MNSSSEAAAFGSGTLFGELFVLIFSYFSDYILLSLAREEASVSLSREKACVCVLSLETLTPQRLSAVQLLSPCPKQDMLSSPAASSKVSLAL